LTSRAAWSSHARAFGFTLRWSVKVFVGVFAVRDVTTEAGVWMSLFDMVSEVIVIVD
jgi:hypothetical protein